MKSRLSWPRTLFLALSLAPLIAGIVSCAEPSAYNAPSGTMDVLGPVPAFEPNAVPLDWVTEGKVDRGQLAVVEREGVPALRVVNGKNNFVTAKPTRASLLATPYLSWSWNMEPQESGTHPVRLVVGFHGGNSDTSLLGSSPLVGRDIILPPHDRAVVIDWGESALQRGSITRPKTTKRKQGATRYTARGGSENTGSWWMETVDLSDIYRRTWPDDRIESTRITFIGIAAAAGKEPSPAYISGLRLSR